MSITINRFCEGPFGIEVKALDITVDSTDTANPTTIAEFDAGGHTVVGYTFKNTGADVLSDVLVYVSNDGVNYALITDDGVNTNAGDLYTSYNPSLNTTYWQVFAKKVKIAATSASSTTADFYILMAKKV